MDYAIEVQGLTKRYGDVVAVDDISFAVRPGEIFGIVGPNGAGKSTVVGIAAGLRSRTSGTVNVLGLDPQRSERRLRERIGIQLQEAELQERLRVEEGVKLYAAFYANPRPAAPLLDQWGLSTKRRSEFRQLSGGQKQRLFIALALINNPELVFLDELTSGLDPQARRLSWDLVRQVRESGTTVVLVTHAMEEAEHLCDRVAVIDRGKVVAIGSPDELTRQASAEQRVRFSTNERFQAEMLNSLPGVASVTRSGDEVLVTGERFLMARVAGALADHEIDPSDLRMERETLDDVFLRLTGAPLRD